MTERQLEEPSTRADSGKTCSPRFGFPVPAMLATLALVWCSLFTGSAIAAGDAVAGKTVFANQCASCHTTEVGKNGFGPSLAQVFERKAGSLAGYTYSPAMVQSGLTWDEKTLDLFLTSSTKEVPGTSMPVSLPNGTDRANVIAYLETLGRATAAVASAPASHAELRYPGTDPGGAAARGGRQAELALCEQGLRGPALCRSLPDHAQERRAIACRLHLSLERGRFHPDQPAGLQRRDVPDDRPGHGGH